MGTLQLREALGIMDDTSKPFSIEFTTYNKALNTGGEIIRLNKCVQVGASHNRKKNDTTVVKQVDRNVHPYPVHNHLIISVNDMEVFI